MSFSIPLSSIDESGRARQDYGDLDGLASSIKTLGSIHPIVLSKDGDKYRLVAGGRRTRAMRLAGLTEIHHGSTLEPGRGGFLFKDEVPQDILKEAELHENLYRKNQKWQEDIVLIADIHALKLKKEGSKNWGQAETGALLKVSASQITRALKIAKLIRAGDAEVLACENVDAVLALLLKRQEEAGLKLQQEKNKTIIAAGGFPSLTGATDSFLDSFTFDNVERKPIEVQQSATDGRVVVNQTAEQKPVAPVPPSGPITIPLSRMFYHGVSVHPTIPRDQWILNQFPDSCVDHIVTDIPYGIDMDNLANVEDVEAEHGIEYNLALMPLFLAEAFRLVRPSGFCVFFYDLDHHEKLQTWAAEAGWRVQSWPLIWTKPYPCRNGAAAYNFTKNFEVAMVLRRDEKTVLRKQQPSSWVSVDARNERSLYNNPFAKPFELWKFIYDAIATPGQTTLDPFWGEGSSSRAAANLGLNPFGIEVKEQHYLRGLEHMKKVFQLVHGPNTQFS